MDPRFDLPLYTRAEVALHLGLPATTLGDWLRSGALEAGRGGRGEPTMTFAGLVETHMLRHLRRTGLSLQAIGEAAVALRSRAGRRYPLAWSGLAHDGRDLLVEIAAEGREAGWERIRDSQGGFPGVLRRGSAAIGWSDDGYAGTLRLVIYPDIDVIVDPTRAHGRPLVDDVPVEDIVTEIRHGTPYRDTATKFNLEDFELEALIRPHLRPAAYRKPLHPNAPADVLL
ncbi:MerR family transcriptional regulator [Kribbella sp. WER1]